MDEKTLSQYNPMKLLRLTALVTHFTLRCTQHAWWIIIDLQNSCHLNCYLIYPNSMQTIFLAVHIMHVLCCHSTRHRTKTLTGRIGGIQRANYQLMYREGQRILFTPCCNHPQTHTYILQLDMTHKNVIAALKHTPLS